MRIALLAAALVTPFMLSAQITVYSNNFESGSAGPAWSGAGSVQTTGGLSAFGFGANHLRNDTQAASLLSLNGLGTHSSMTLMFDLAMWDSIDYGDTFQIFVDGNPLFNGGAFGNYFTPSEQCEGPGTRLTPGFTSFSSPDYGYSTAYHDCARTASYTFAHSAATAVFSFAYPNSQGGLDESFGLDNVVVKTNAAPSSTAAPEPGTLVLLGTGLFGAFGVSRRRKSART